MTRSEPHHAEGQGARVQGQLAGVRGGDQPRREKPEKEATLERGPQHRGAGGSRDGSAPGVIPDQQVLSGFPHKHSLCLAEELRK